MVWDPFGMWVRYVAPDTKEIAPSASPNKRKGKTVRPCNECGEAPKCLISQATCRGRYWHPRTASPVA